jgi:hypothetical protein
MTSPQSNGFAFLVNPHPLLGLYLAYMIRMPKTTNKNLKFCKPKEQ